MNPFRIFLLAALVLVIFGIGNADASHVTANHIKTIDEGNGLEIMLIVDDFMYTVGDGGTGIYPALDIYDVSNVTNPQKLSSYSSNSSILSPRTVKVVGDYAFLDNWGTGGFTILDVSDKTAPSEVYKYETNNSNSARCDGSYKGRGIGVSDNYLFYSCYNGFIELFDISDPYNPEFITDFTGVSQQWNLAVFGDYAYIVSRDNPTRVYDIQNELEFVSEFGSSSYDIQFISPYFAITISENTYYIWNISNPSEVSYVSQGTTSVRSTFGSVVGNYVYLGGTNDGDISIIDISDLNQPFEETTFNVGNTNGILAVNEDYFYKGYSKRINIYKIDDNHPPSSTISSIFPSPGRFDDEFSFTGSGYDQDGTVETYVWRSSLDGKIGNGMTIDVANLSIGEHTIKLLVEDNEGRSCELLQACATEILVVNPNSRPTATIDSVKDAYSVNISSAEQGTNVFFNGTGFDSDGTVEVYFWESSIDGFLSNDENFSITNLSIGRHTVYFEVQDNDGEWSSTSQWDLWIYTVPIAFAGQNATGTPGVPLQFSGAGTDEDGTIAKYEWDFDGDGIFEWSSTENGRELNIYNNEGTYTATLRVTDNDGFTSSDTVTVIISEKTIQLDDDGNVVVEDAGEDDEGIPSISLITSLISIGLLAIFRRK